MTKFDIVDYLDSEELIVEYLNKTRKNDNPAVFAIALANATRARGTLQLAKDTGVDYKKLCKMLSSGEIPSSRLADKITAALGAPVMPRESVKQELAHV